MPDDPWAVVSQTPTSATPAATGGWEVASETPAAPQPTLQPPNAIAQSQAAIRKPIEQDQQGLVGNLYRNITQPDPKAMSAYMGMGEEKEIAQGAPPAAKAMLEMGGGGAAAGAVKGAGMLPALLRMIAAGAGGGAGNIAGQVLNTGKVDPQEALKTAGGFAAGEGAGQVIGKVAEGVGNVAKKISPTVDPLAKINKILGVGPKEIRVGKMPDSLDALSANPARGAMKAGLDEKTLSKMDPLERNTAIQKARDAAGQKLDQVLKAAGDAGKKVDIYKTLKETFEGIPDAKIAKQAEEKLRQILMKNNLIDKQLSQLTPMEARTIQRGLDDFANFASGDAVKTFRDVATNLRRGISAATRKAVPESAPLDQDYGDLVNASKATQKAVSKFARTVPENKLRKWIIRSAVGGGAYELGKHMGAPLP